MQLSLRQWLVVLGLIVGFAIAAIAVRGDSGTNETNLPPIDQAAWCTGATGLIGAGDLLDGQRAEASAVDFEAVKEAVYDVEVLAPWELRKGLSRIADFSIIARQQFDTAEWPDAFAAARSQVDVTVVDQAIQDLRTEMSLCGHDLDG